jgi:hypothetical protein
MVILGGIAIGLLVFVIILAAIASSGGSPVEMVAPDAAVAPAPKPAAPAPAPAPKLKKR